MNPLGRGSMGEERGKMKKRPVLGRNLGVELLDLHKTCHFASLRDWQYWVHYDACNDKHPVS